MVYSKNWGAKAIFDSEGVRNVVSALAPHGGPSGTSRFPTWNRWVHGETRVNGPGSGMLSPATLRQWFQQVVGNESGDSDRIADMQIEDNIACLGTIQWSEGHLIFCRMQVLVTTGGDLMDFYLGENTSMGGYYYRLELDPSQPGPLFTEPQPHVHTQPDGPPRFPFHSPPDDFLPLSFLEFIFLNHKPQQWKNWAERVCKSQRPDLPFKNLADQFASGKISENLEKYETHLEDLKKILRAAKRQVLDDAPKLGGYMSVLNYQNQ